MRERSDLLPRLVALFESMGVQMTEPQARALLVITCGDAVGCIHARGEHAHVGLGKHEYVRSVVMYAVAAGRDADASIARALESWGKIEAALPRPLNEDGEPDTTNARLAAEAQ